MSVIEIDEAQLEQRAWLPPVRAAYERLERSLDRRVEQLQQDATTRSPRKRQPLPAAARRGIGELIDLVLGADPLAASQAVLALNLVGGLAAQEVGRRLDAAADLRSRTRLMVLYALVGRGLPGVLMKVLAIAAEHDDPEHRDAATRASRLVFGDLAHQLAAAPR
jgi:hypothetical protein